MPAPTNLFDLDFQAAVSELEKEAAEKRAAGLVEGVQSALRGGREAVKGMADRFRTSTTKPTDLAVGGGLVGAGLGAAAGGLTGRGGLSNAVYGGLLGGAMGAAAGGGAGLLRDEVISKETIPEKIPDLDKNINDAEAKARTMGMIAGGPDWSASDPALGGGTLGWLARRTGGLTGQVTDLVNNVAPGKAIGTLQAAADKFGGPGGNDRNWLEAGKILAPTWEQADAGSMLRTSATLEALRQAGRTFIRNPRLIRDLPDTEAGKRIFAGIPYWQKVRAGLPIPGNANRIFGGTKELISPATIKDMARQGSNFGIKPFLSSLAKDNKLIPPDALQKMREQMAASSDKTNLLRQWAGGEVDGAVGLQKAPRLTRLKEFVKAPIYSTGARLGGSGPLMTPNLKGTGFSYGSGGVTGAQIGAKLDAGRPSMRSSLLRTGLMHGGVQWLKNLDAQARALSKVQSSPAGATQTPTASPAITAPEGSPLWQAQTDLAAQKAQIQEALEALNALKAQKPGVK